MTRKDDNGDQPSGGGTTWANTGAARYGRGQHKTGQFGDGMLRLSPNHGTQRLPNDDDLCFANVTLHHWTHWVHYEHDDDDDDDGDDGVDDDDDI